MKIFYLWMNHSLHLNIFLLYRYVQIQSIHKTVREKYLDVLILPMGFWSVHSMDSFLSHEAMVEDWCCRSHDSDNMADAVHPNSIYTTHVHAIEHAFLTSQSKFQIKCSDFRCSGWLLFDESLIHWTVSIKTMICSSVNLYEWAIESFSQPICSKLK